MNRFHFGNMITVFVRNKNAVQRFRTIGEDSPSQRFCSQRIRIDRDPEPATENCQAGTSLGYLLNIGRD
jgi:hypothetical protein